MERFSPEQSKIFSAAAFVNVYSSTPVVLSRVGLSFTLLLALFLTSTSGLTNSFLLILAVSINYFIFEVFYRAKIFSEHPNPLDQAQNLADSFTMGAARFILKNKNKSSLDSIFFSLVKDTEIAFVLHRSDISNDTLQKNVSSSSEMLGWPKVVETASKWSVKEKRNFIDKLDILLAIFSHHKDLQKFFFDKQIKEADLLNIVYWVRSNFEGDRQHFWEKPVESLGPGMAEFWLGGWTLETERYATDLTKHMQKGKLSAHLVGRDKEIRLVEEVLSRSDKKNVVLLGEPGIGKKTIVYSLTENSIKGLLPEALKYKRFMEIDVTSLMAGADRGELEQRIQNLLTEISHADNVVLFIPNIENLAGGSGTGINITGHLLSALGSGKLQVIATSTRESYHRHIEGQSSFASAFEVIDIPEASPDSTIRILEDAVPAIESKNKVLVTYKAIQKTVELADKYIVDRQLPGKAIDLLDEVATAVSIRKKQLLEEADVEETVSQKTRIPVGKAKATEAKELINLEKILHQRIVGQNEAITAVANALRRARAIEKAGKRPIGAFLFLGPTGVGKTETAKTLAEYYFKSEESIIRIDMSEFQEDESLNRLIGAPPGKTDYGEGGQLTEKVRQNPYSLVLLDEIEKAAKVVQEAFLPIIDEGVVTDSSGRKISFSNTIIIATSNAGADFIHESIHEGRTVDHFKRELIEELQKEHEFKPEFLNRFDDIVVYKPLSPEEVEKVVSIMIGKLGERLKKQDIGIDVSPEAVSLISQQGFDREFGARPLNRFIADQVEEKIAEKILSEEVKRGSKVNVSVLGNQLLIQ